MPFSHVYFEMDWTQTTLTFLALANPSTLLEQSKTRQIWDHF